MMVKMFGRIVTVLTLFLIDITFGVENEPLCLSRYDYDYKMLQKLVEMEQKQETMRETLAEQGSLISQQKQVIEDLRSEQKGSIQNLKQRISDVQMVSGSTYVRWGRSVCPDDGTETVYGGYVGGSHYTHTGAAVNYLCLPSDPIWGKYENGIQSRSYVYGAEYEQFGEYSQTLYGKVVGNNDVPCAVCRSTRPSSVMIPGRTACYGNWTLEYTGYLASGATSHKAASEYVCLEGSPDIISGGESDQNGILFYVTEARCGSLKCPPYVEGRELSCVVCTL